MTRARLDALRAEHAAIAAEVRARVGADAPHRTAADRAQLDRDLAALALGFRGWAHRGATGLLRVALGAVFAPAVDGPQAAAAALDDRLEIAGAAAVAAVGDAALVFAPTHGANLDAIVLGMALERAGLAPTVYLAGEHLYRNPLVAAAMRTQGAVRLDRARTDRRYLAVVAAYVGALAARGAPLTIFPGGTRRRDGTLERELRLGLIAAAVRAARARAAGVRRTGDDQPADRPRGGVAGRLPPARPRPRAGGRRRAVRARPPDRHRAPPARARSARGGVVRRADRLRPRR